LLNLIWLIAASLGPLIWLIPMSTGLGAEAGAGHHHCAAEQFLHCALGAGGHAALSGLAIVSSAFLLSWATELAEEFVPPSFALIVLGLVSVLPEYAVDMHITWQAGQDDSYRALAVANMTGANRILIGIGWSMLVFVRFFRGGHRVLDVHPAQRLELGFLLLATVYSLVLPIRGHLSLMDSAVFIAIFGVYVFRALKSEPEDHPLFGPAAWIHARVNKAGRIAVITGFGVFACYAIWMSAEPFAEGLIHIGGEMSLFGMDADSKKFLLIQLVAPLASESPEFIVAILFVIRHRASTALGALVSSKVNQWTLLVGAIPIVYAFSSGEWNLLVGMELEETPRAELLLTSAQSMFAIAVLSDLRFTLREATALLVLFVAPWLLSFIPGLEYWFSALYFVLVLVVGFRTPQRRRDFARLLRLRG
jgi:cation:H+ antiporter